MSMIRETAGRYVLDCHTASEPTDAQPHDFSHDCLTGALVGAWLNDKAGGQNEVIRKDRKIIFDKAELSKACRQMSKLEIEEPNLNFNEIAEHVIQKMGKE